MTPHNTNSVSAKIRLFQLIALAVCAVFLVVAGQQLLKHRAGIFKRARPLMAPLQVIFRYFDFNERTALKQWEEKTFRGQVHYWIDFDKTNGFVHSKSKDASSAIFYRLKFDAYQYPYLAWKWRIGTFPDKKGSQDPKKRDDFAARVYVVFVSHFFTNFHCVEYVWDESIPAGTILASPYSDQIKLLVVQSGTDKNWAVEKQNIIEDYQKLFGRKPKMKVAAIALMTDSEGTGSEAEGFFDDIQIGGIKLGHNEPATNPTDAPSH